MRRQKYSYLFERDSEEPAPRGRRRVVWAPWSSSARSSAGSRTSGGGTCLTPGEKAGVLGMVVVVVVILGLVITSGESPEAAPLNPDSHASKIKRALDQQGQPVGVVGLDKTPLHLQNKPANLTGKAFKEKWPGSNPVSPPLKKPVKTGKPISKPVPKTPAYRTYVIRKGDMLSTISRKLLGRSSRWREILKLNPELNERNLTPGRKIRIPAR